MKILITGASGFVAGHLISHLEKQGHAIAGLSNTATAHKGLEQYYQADLRDGDGLKTIVEETQPDVVYHLAAQSHVGSSFSDPWHTLENNIRSTLNLFEALRGSDTKVLLASSSEVYGQILEADLPISEKQPTRPNNPYGVSKMAQELLAHQYIASNGLAIYIARPFNHIGARQSHRFAIANFANQIARMEKGLQSPILMVGNLSAQRDFSNVQDVIEGYDAILTHGEVGEPYNIGSGVAYAIQELVDMLIDMATVQIKIEVEQTRLRPIDVPRIIADTSKLQQLSGWQPKISMQETLQAVLDDARLALAS